MTHTIDPAAWDAFVGRYRVGDTLAVEVVSVRPFGAFVRTAEGVDGLAPHADWPALPPVGTRVTARIVAVDPEQRRFALAPV